MKILLIQLSDIHCGTSFNEYDYFITQAVNTITKTNSYDKIVLIFSGDLTNSAHPNEFKTGRRIIGAFLVEKRCLPLFIYTALKVGYSVTKIKKNLKNFFLA